MKKKTNPQTPSSSYDAGDQAYTRLKAGVDQFMVNLYNRKQAAKGGGGS